jgi:hypothetical protein
MRNILIGYMQVTQFTLPVNCYFHPSLVFGNKLELEPIKVEPIMVGSELYPKILSYSERD